MKVGDHSQRAPDRTSRSPSETRRATSSISASVELGRRLGEDVRRVGDDHPRGGGREVDVVEADRVVRHHAEPVARGVEELGVDPVRQHRQKPDLPGDAGQELLAGGGRSESCAPRSKSAASSRCTSSGTLRERKTDSFKKSSLPSATRAVIMPRCVS